MIATNIRWINLIAEKGLLIFELSQLSQLSRD